MINFLDILEDFYTDEDNQKFDTLTEKIKELDAKTEAEHGKAFTKLRSSLREGKTIKVDLGSWEDNYFKERDRLSTERNEIYRTVILRYRREKKIEGIFEDVRKIADNYEIEDYHQHLDNVRESLKRLENMERFNIHLKIEGTDRQGRSIQSYLKQASEENYINCFNYLYDNNYPELEAILNGEDLQKAIGIFTDRIDSFGYKRPTQRELSAINQGGLPILPELPKYDFVYPTDFQQNLTKASKKIFDSSIALSELKQAEIDITPNKKGGLTSFSVYVDMTAPELKGTENVTEYDKSVHNMAVSIGKVNEHGFFTARELATALIHGDNPNNNRVSSQQIGAVTKSIEKQRHIDITIDWTEHIKLNNKGNIPEDASSFKIKDYMLPVRELSATIGGKTLHGYQFIDPVKLSPLYQYASSVGQIGQHPVKMLNVPINLDQQKLVIRDFLLEEIAHIKKNKNWNNTISVDTLLKIAGEDVATITRKKRSALLQAVENMLTYWKEEAYIKDYKRNRTKTTGSPLQSFTILT